MFLNAGGVTVSYFEWLKNLSHVRFGRMDKRFTENTNKIFVEEIERLTGQSMESRHKELLVHGAGEEDLVNSGLEDTMITSYNHIRDTWKKEFEDQGYAHSSICGGN
jgi:glutamate dehydrogenase (NAD(P)+)